MISKEYVDGLELRIKELTSERNALIQLKGDLQDTGLVMMQALEKIEEDSCDYNHDELARRALEYVKKVLSR